MNRVKYMIPTLMIILGLVFFEQCWAGRVKLLNASLYPLTYSVDTVDKKGNEIELIGAPGIEEQVQPIININEGELLIVHYGREREYEIRFNVNANNIIAIFNFDKQRNKFMVTISNQ